MILILFEFSSNKYKRININDDLNSYCNHTAKHWFQIIKLKLRLDCKGLTVYSKFSIFAAVL